jgi:hypothetical protein
MPADISNVMVIIAAIPMTLPSSKAPVYTKLNYTRKAFFCIMQSELVRMEQKEGIEFGSRD